MTSKNSYGWVQPQPTTPRAGGGGGGVNDRRNRSGIEDFYLGKGPGANPDGSPGSPNFWGDDYGTGANDFSGYGNPQQSGYAQDLLSQWSGNPDLQNLDKYRDQRFRDSAEAYANSYGVPMGNLLLAQQGQNFNEFANSRDFREQMFLNRAGLDLQKQGSAREDKALQAGIDQFGQRFGLESELGRGQLANETTNIANQFALGQGRNSNELLGIQNQFTLGQQANANTAQNNAWNYELGQGSLANQAQNNAWNYELGQGANANNAQANANTAQNNAWNYQLGQGRNSNELLGIQNQFALGQQANSNNLLGIQGQNQRYQGQTANEQYANQTNRQLGQQANANTLLGIQGQNARYQGQTANEQFANQTALTGVQNQYALGQGQLSFQNRQLDTTNSFNDRQLAQQADLTREKYKNDLTQSRYSAFGRAATPNQRATQSWY